MALRAPDHLGKTIHHLVLGFMTRTQLLGELAMQRSYAGWLIDRYLLVDGKVHRQMQEGVGLALLSLPVAGERCVTCFEQRVVFRMERHQVGGDGFQRREGKRIAALFPGVDQELPGFVAGGGEHAAF